MKRATCLSERRRGHEVVVSMCVIGGERREEAGENGVSRNLSRNRRSRLPKPRPLAANYMRHAGVIVEEAVTRSKGDWLDREPETLAVLARARTRRSAASSAQRVLISGSGAPAAAAAPNHALALQALHRRALPFDRVEAAAAARPRWRRRCSRRRCRRGRRRSRRLGRGCGCRDAREPSRGARAALRCRRDGQRRVPRGAQRRRSRRQGTPSSIARAQR